MKQIFRVNCVTDAGNSGFVLLLTVQAVSSGQNVRMSMNRSDPSVALYVRLSRDENGDKADSIETQQKILESFSNKYFPGKSVRIYIDDNVSGVTFDRPALNNFTSDVRHGLVDTLILKDLSRLGRSNAKTLLFLEEAELSGVRVITTDGRYDSEKNFELAGIDSWFNERYVMDISRKIRSNIKQKIESGQYIGTAPYGYRKKTGISNVLEPDPITAPVVKDIFNLYVNGFGYKKIADILDKKGILPPSPSRSKSLRWNPVTIKRILANRVYLGTTIQGISRKVSFKSKKTCRLPSDMWTVTAGTHEPLVTADLWEKAASTSASRRAADLSRTNTACLNSLKSAVANSDGSSASGAPSINFFKGIIRCGLCGGSMVRRISKGRPAAYICAQYAKHGAEYCCRNGIRLETLLRVVAPDISRIAGAQYELSVDSNKNICQTDVKNEKRTLPIKNVEYGEDVLRKKQESVYNDYLDGKISENLFLRMNKIIEDKIANLTDFVNMTELAASPEYFDKSKLLGQLNEIAELVSAHGFSGFREFFGNRHYCDKIDLFNQFLFAEAVRLAVCSVTVCPDEVTILYRIKIH